jgi:phospholipid transport system substrate-binding protein
MSRSIVSTCLRFATIPVVAAFAALTAAGVSAQRTDPAAARIDSLHRALIETMKQGKQLGLKGRYDKLAPVLFKIYDVPLMARIAVGPGWDSLAPPQQSNVVDAFSRMMVATYASRFDEFSGERFDVLQTVEQPPTGKIVKTRVTQSNGKTVSLNYLMRPAGTEWKVVDVFLNGTISELANRRAEFTAILKSGGPSALITSLRQQGDKLLAGG